VDEGGKSGIWVLRKMGLGEIVEKRRQSTLAYNFEELGIKVRALGQVNNLKICVNL
jgi:hypothetical protein